MQKHGDLKMPQLVFLRKFDLAQRREEYALVMYINRQNKEIPLLLVCK
jgi:hypothetical protein